MTNPALQAPGCSRGEDVSKYSCREAVTPKRGHMAGGHGHMAENLGRDR